MDRIVLDGFAYEIRPGTIRREGKADPEKVVLVTYTDDGRGIQLETWFPEDGWDAFRADVNGGVFVPSGEALNRLGV